MTAALFTVSFNGPTYCPGIEPFRVDHESITHRLEDQRSGASPTRAVSQALGAVTRVSNFRSSLAHNPW